MFHITSAELLAMVVSHLGTDDYLSFRTICRNAYSVPVRDIYIRGRVLAGDKGALRLAVYYQMSPSLVRYWVEQSPTKAASLVRAWRWYHLVYLAWRGIPIPDLTIWRGPVMRSYTEQVKVALGWSCQFIISDVNLDWELISDYHRMGMAPINPILRLFHGISGNHERVCFLRRLLSVLESQMERQPKRRDYYWGILRHINDAANHLPPYTCGLIVHLSSSVGPHVGEYLLHEYRLERVETWGWLNSYGGVVTTNILDWIPPIPEIQWAALQRLVPQVYQDVNYQIQYQPDTLHKIRSWCRIREYLARSPEWRSALRREVCLGLDGNNFEVIPELVRQFWNSLEPDYVLSS